jgi:ABC-type amino acid transport substrate-binding protein
MRFKLIVICCAMFMLPGVGAAEVKLGVVAIPGVLEADKSGDYDKVLARVGAVAGKPFKYVVLPPNRIEADLKSGDIDCLLPMDARYWKEKGNYVNSEPLNVAKSYFFSRQGDGPYTSLDQVKGKTIGIRTGLPYGPKLDGYTQLAAVASDDQNVQKLNSKRIDVFLAYMPDMSIWAKEKKAALPSYKADTPFDTHRDAFLCRNTPEVQEFLKAFNPAVVKLRDSGELKKLLGDSFVP